jgi:hypothetical protein
MKKIVEMEDILNAICQDCGECDHKDCPYEDDCSLVEIVSHLSRIKKKFSPVIGSTAPKR